MRFTVLKKFSIKEAQIDNFNDTNNLFKKFDEGVNIICGLNEAGKSTLMDFIKSVFVRKSTDAKGYIKCECDGESFTLNTGNTKILKENEKYLNGITAHDFQTGFVINIDDLMFAKKSNAEELLNTIKDSSGNAVNQKKEEYSKNIYDPKKQKFSLTNSNGASSNFKKQFENLKKLDSNIKDLMAKEDEYNRICSELDNTNNELKYIKEKNECAQKILEKNRLEFEKNNIKINKKLIENKSDFDAIRLDFGGLKSLKDKESELIEKIEKNKLEFEEKFKQLNRLETFDYNVLEEFDLSKENLNFGKDLIERQKELTRQKSDILSKINDKNKEISELEFNKKTTENVLIEKNIDNPKQYKDDINLLESYSDHYSDILNKMRTSNIANTKSGKWYSDIFLLLFGAMFFAVLGTLILYWNTGVRLPMIALLLVSVAGINTTIMQNIERKRDTSQTEFSVLLKKDEKEIISVCKKYNYDILPDDKFTVKLNAFIKKMSDNISDYDYVEKDLLSYRMGLNRANDDLEKYESTEAEIDKQIEKLNKEKVEFLSKINIKSLENLEEIFDYIKLLKDLQEEGKSVEESLKLLDTNTEKFAQNLNEFIQKCCLENYKTYNKYEYDEFSAVIDSIDKVVAANNSAKTLFDEIELKIKNCDTGLSGYSPDLLDELSEIDDEKILDLRKILEEKTEEKARLSQQKDDLEQVSGLYALKNEKNVELNKIKNSLSKLIQTEIIYNVIERSQEKFNETQPNFVCAKEYFAKITNGKYDEIDFENKTISGKDIGDKDWDELSRGTKEQLYLAFRLGYASNYSKDIDGNLNGRPNLPIIIDDAFVNFDKERTSAILKCLSEFSKTNQVLYFTCHTDSVKEILKKEKIKHNFIEM